MEIKISEMTYLMVITLWGISLRTVEWAGLWDALNDTHLCGSLIDTAH